MLRDGFVVEKPLIKSKGFYDQASKDSKSSKGSRGSKGFRVGLGDGESGFACFMGIARFTGYTRFMRFARFFVAFCRHRK